jgi:hypothetical protein
MRVSPSTRKECFKLILFPFKVYVVLAPVGLVVWQIANEGNRVRGALMEAEGRIALGYFICFLTFIILEHRRFVWALAAFVVPIFILSGGSLWLVVILVFASGCKLSQRAAHFPETQNEEIECIICHATVPARREKCPECGWTYLV